jgi:hypothetical protein
MVPDKKAFSTSSTCPDIHGISLIPAVVIIWARGLDIAPQMSVSTPNPVSLITLLGRKCSLISASNREYSPSSPASTTNSLEAVSNTGDTLPFHVGMAIFMSALFKVRLSAAFSASSLKLCRPYTQHDMGRNRDFWLVENQNTSRD